jgi:hypothetical protein
MTTTLSFPFIPLSLACRAVTICGLVEGIGGLALVAVGAGDEIPGGDGDGRRNRDLPTRFLGAGAARRRREYDEDPQGGARNHRRVPPGAMIVKDSFTVTGQGAILTGPLFLMEKMDAGFNARDGDWRYMMIGPDGTIAGLSGGVNSRNVEFCAECHNAAPTSHDRLFFMPDAVRLR